MSDQPRHRRSGRATQLAIGGALAAALALPGVANAREWTIDVSAPTYAILTTRLAPSRGEAWEVALECNLNLPGVLHITGVDTAGPDDLGENLNDRQGRHAPTRTVPGRVSSGAASAPLSMNATYSPSVRGRMIMFDGALPLASPTTSAFRRGGAIRVTVNGRIFAPSSSVPAQMLLRFSRICH